MAIKKGQMRYISDNFSSKNYPNNLTASMLTSGTMFENTIRIHDLKISGGFGLKFFLNDTPTPISIRRNQLHNNPIEFQEWELPTGAQEITNMPIYSLRFEPKSLQHFIDLNNTLTDSQQYLFIDYTYETMD